MGRRLKGRRGPTGCIRQVFTSAMVQAAVELTQPQRGYSSFSSKKCPQVGFHDVPSGASTKARVPGVRQHASHGTFGVLSVAGF